MPRYRITHRPTGATAEVEAPFAQDACQLLGWLIGDCHVRLLREGPYSDLTQQPQPASAWALYPHGWPACPI